MTDREDRPFKTLIWRGITIHIREEAPYCGMQGLNHLDIEAVAPERTPLPFTETGYRSHFYYGEPVADAVEAVLAWLEEAAEEPEWKAREAASRQLTLF